MLRAYYINSPGRIPQILPSHLTPAVMAAQSLIVTAAWFLYFVLGFALSSIANVLILVILYDCLPDAFVIL